MKMKLLMKMLNRMIHKKQMLKSHQLMSVKLQIMMKKGKYLSNLNQSKTLYRLKNEIMTSTLHQM